MFCEFCEMKCMQNNWCQKFLIIVWFLYFDFCSIDDLYLLRWNGIFFFFDFTSQNIYLCILLCSWLLISILKLISICNFSNPCEILRNVYEFVCYINFSTNLYYVLWWVNVYGLDVFEIKANWFYNIFKLCGSRWEVKCESCLLLEF